MVRPAPTPWWPLWVAGGAVLAAAAAGNAARALPAYPSPQAIGLAAAAVAGGVGAFVLARARTAGPTTVLGRRADFPWTPVRIGLEERLRHVHCLGPSGSGKTTSVLAPMLLQDLAAGAGLAVIEIKGGELCSIARAAAERLGREVAEWEPSSLEGVAWNPLADPSPAAAERLVYALQRAAGQGSAAADYYAAVGGNVLRHAVAAFASAGEPVDLLRLRTFLTDPGLRQGILAGVRDRDVLEYFRTVFDAWRPDERLRNIQGVLNHLDGLLAHPAVRRALCPAPGAPSLDLGDCLRRGTVLLVRLPLGGMLRLAEALGTFLLAGLQAATYARGRDEPPYFLYLDEFQHFCGPGFAEFLALARGFRVGAVLAHQNLAQLRQAGGTALQETVLANARTTILLRPDGPDAAALAPWLPAHGGRPWKAEELAALPFGVGVVRCMAGRRPRAHLLRLRPVAPP